MKAQPLFVLTALCVFGSVTSIALAFVPSTTLVTLATRLTMMQF